MPYEVQILRTRTTGKMVLIAAACSALITSCTPATQQKNSSNAPPSAAQPASPSPVFPGGANLTHETAPAAARKINHVVIVIEENHGFNEIIGNSAAPYINFLANQGALFTNARAVEHPSEPNYLDLFSGSNQGITNDSCPHTFTAPNLGSELLTKQLTFGGFSEDLPSAGYSGCSSGKYARKHNPWVNFSNLPSSCNRPLSEFPSDFNQLPTVAFVVPNLAHDMHDGTIQQGDSWLKDHLDPYVQWAKTHNSLLILTWDEDDASSENRIPTLFVGPMVRPGQYGESINHFGLLRAVEDVYELALLGQSGSAQPLTDLWKFQ